MSRELLKRLARIEAERGPCRMFVDERRPDGSRHRISGEGEPRPCDLVVTVIRRFEDHQEIPNLTEQPKEG